jgi:pimeloyl-ACP methyl ester carboxylesterase
MIHTHVIALHCSGSSAKQWRHLSQSLGSLTQMWAPDLIGCGSSRHWGGDRHFALADEAAPIVSMLDALARPVHLVGHSYGGAVALRVARERPSLIAGLTLYEPMALHVLKAAGPEGRDALAAVNSVAAEIDQAVLAGDCRTAARRFVEYWNRPGAWDALSPDAQAELIRYIPKACLEIRAVAHERTPLAAYRHFRVPVLLLQGQRAPEATQIIGRQLARAMRFASLRTVFAAVPWGR